MYDKLWLSSHYERAFIIIKHGIYSLLKYRNIYKNIYENNSQKPEKHWENCIVEALKGCILCVTIDA